MSWQCKHFLALFGVVDHALRRYEVTMEVLMRELGSIDWMRDVVSLYTLHTALFGFMFITYPSHTHRLLTRGIPGTCK